MSKRIKEPKRVYPATRDIGITWATNDFFKFEVASVKNITPNAEIHVCLTPMQGKQLARELVTWLERIVSNPNAKFQTTAIHLESQPRFQTAPKHYGDIITPEFIHKKKK